MGTPCGYQVQLNTHKKNEQGATKTAANKKTTSMHDQH